VSTVGPNAIASAQFSMGEGSFGTASQAFDTTLTATVPFTFGEEVAFQRYVDASAGFVPPYDPEHPDGPSGGFVEATFQATWEKATVLDADSQEVAATISSASGFDYLNPVPEPTAFDADIAALAALLALRRGRRAAS